MENFLLNLGHRILENFISIIAICISFYSYRQSKEANKIALEANQLAKLDLEFSSDRDKKNKMNNIINEIVNNWSKNGGARVILITQWNINKDEGFTTDDFNKIWNIAYHKVKNKSPSQSFEEILSQSNK